MATPFQIEELRLLLGETIPEGGSPDDTMFTDEQLSRWLDKTATLERAAFEGWRAKAAQYADLVNVTDGAATREMGELLKNAERMVRLYSKSTGGSTYGRSRVGRIVRRD